MKRLFASIFSISLLTACSTQALDNSSYDKENGNENFNIDGNLILSDFPIDGILESDKYADPAMTVEMGGLVDFETKVTAKVVFGENGLTIGFDSKDKYLASSTDYNDPQFVVNSDNVEFYIDVLNDKGKKAQPDDFAFLVNPEEYIEMRNGTGSYWSGWSGVVDYAVKVNGTINNDGDIDVGWTCELFLPYQTFGFTKDSIIGVAFGCRDKNSFEMYSRWTGCGPDPQNINTYISIDKDGPIPSKVNELTINNGGFEYEDEEYVSSNFDALGTFDDKKIKEGTLSIDVYIPNEAINYDNGITLQVNAKKKVFWEDESVNYYFFFISRDGDAVIGKANNSEWIAHSIYENVPYLKGNWNTFKVVLANNYLTCFINDNFLFASYCYLEELPFGIRCGAQNVKYKNITISDSIEGGYVGIEGYHISNGNFEQNIDDNTVTVTEISGDGAILTCNEKLASGTLETKVNIGTANDCGIIFKLDDKRRANYWEEGVSYYFFFINRDGMLFLGKVNEGVWETLSNLPISKFDITREYTLKVTYDETTYKCYLDNNLYFTGINDDEILTGQGYGLRAGAVGTTFTLFGGE